MDKEQLLELERASIDLTVSFQCCSYFVGLLLLLCFD